MEISKIIYVIMEDIEITLVSEKEYILEEMEEWMNKYFPWDFADEEIYEDKLINKLEEVLDEVLD